MITAVSMVKNSADVLETMIRGNALVVDNFVIINNSSTDNTEQIIGALIEEGFRIDIIQDESISPYQRDRVSEAIRYAIDTYHPDIILPLDDDEIVCTQDDDMSPFDLKDYLLSLDYKNLYYVNWRNYIPSNVDDESVICVALREKYCLDDEPDMTKKVIIPASIAGSYDFKLGWGGHFAEGSEIKQHVLLDKVRLAHYPIRSSVQMASKVIVGWMNYLAMPDRDKDLSVHWQVMYKAVKEYGLPTVDTMMTLANLYREHPNDVDNLNVVCHPINIPDAMFDLQYTRLSEVNLLKNICENYEKLAENYAALLREDSMR